MKQLLNLQVPYPHPDLRPNARKHWAAKAKAKKSARASALWLTRCQMGAGLPEIPEDVDIHLYIDVAAPTRRNMDRDNLLASLKAHIDGISEAIGIDDERFIFHPIERREPNKHRPNVGIKLVVQ